MGHANRKYRILSGILAATTAAAAGMAIAERRRRTVPLESFSWLDRLMIRLRRHNLLVMPLERVITPIDKLPTPDEDRLLRLITTAGWPTRHPKRQFDTDDRGAFVVVPTPRGFAEFRFGGQSGNQFVLQALTHDGSTVEGNELPDVMRRPDLFYHDFLRLELTPRHAAKAD